MARLPAMLVAPLISLCVHVAHALPSSSPRAVSGCGREPNLSDTISHYREIKSSNRTRDYLFRLPEDYDHNKAYPVIVGFHDSSSNGLGFAADSGIGAYNYTGNKIMIYPDGVDGSWAGPSYAKVGVPEDLQFIADVLDDVKNNFCVDERRIYATGISNGGGFVNTMACSVLSSQFAAFAPVAGSFYTDVNGEGCNFTRTPLPLLEIHGEADKTVPYDGGDGEGGKLPAILTWLGYWYQRDACTNTAKDVDPDKRVNHLMWTCGDKVGVLQHYQVLDMGSYPPSFPASAFFAALKSKLILAKVYEWPEKHPTLSGIVAGDLDGTSIDANGIIVSFFDQWSL